MIEHFKDTIEWTGYIGRQPGMMGEVEKTKGNFLLPLGVSFGNDVKRPPLAHLIAVELGYVNSRVRDTDTDTTTLRDVGQRLS